MDHNLIFERVTKEMKIAVDLAGDIANSDVAAPGEEVGTGSTH